MTVLAVVWAYIDYGYGTHFGIVEPFQLTFTIPFLAFRLPFVYQVDRYYRRATTRRRALMLGVVADGPGLFMPLLMLATILFSLPIGLYLFIPTPVLLLAGALVMWLKPVPACQMHTGIDAILISAYIVHPPGLTGLLVVQGLAQRKVFEKSSDIGCG